MNRLDDPTFDDIAVIGRWAGYGLLFLALPIALFAAMMLPNEYEAMGFSGIDCDGPLHVFMFAYPAFAFMEPPPSPSC